MPITHFTVFGERCSGTNHAVTWLEKNTGLRHRSDLAWKHGMIPTDRLRKDRNTLCVVVARNLPDWLRSLHIKPHHLSPKMRGLTLHEFATRRVESMLDHTMGVSPHDRRFGEPLPGEQHQGKPYANVIRMRRHKYRQWLKDMGRLHHAVLLRHEDLVWHPEAAYASLQQVCPLPERTAFERVDTYKGATLAVTYKPKVYAPLSAETVRHVLEQMDPAVETQLGYDSATDVQAAAMSATTPDTALLRTTLDGHPAALAALEAMETKLREQQSLLLHADAQRESLRRYLHTLTHAITSTRRRFAFWRW
ncbi:MAG: hypothetical protein KA004_04895 [Verrucomicrobiales bacterium]|nr:hypothetical protein [Verrucomicrobiales bacterium]